MVTAAQKGDSDSFAACFAVPSEYFDWMRRIHEQRSELTGHLVSDVEILGDGTASLLLELVYRRENARHKVEMKQTGGDWKIVALTSIDRFEPAIRYGTFVTPQRDTDR